MMVKRFKIPLNWVSILGFVTVIVGLIFLYISTRISTQSPRIVIGTFKISTVYLLSFIAVIIGFLDIILSYFVTD